MGGSFEPQWGLGKNEGWKDFVARCVVDEGELFVHEILKLTRQKTSWEQHHWKGYLERKEWFLKCLQARLGDGGETGNVDGNNLIEQAIKDPKRVGFHVSWGNRDLKCVPNLERLAVLMMTVEDSKKAFTKKQGASKGTKKERQDRIEVEPSWRAHIKELALRLTPDAKRVCDNIEVSLNSRGFSEKFFASSVQLYT